MSILKKALKTHRERHKVTVTVKVAGYKQFWYFEELLEKGIASKDTAFPPTSV